MKRTNTVADVLNTGTARVDVGDGVILNLPLDGVYAGEQGPAGVGVPDGGTALQVVRKDAAGIGTEWATTDKTLVGLSNVDNTSDAGKPVSEQTAVALAEKLDTDALDAAAAALFNDPESALRGAQSATYAPSRARNLTDANLRRIRVALGKAATATGAARILGVGDSIKAGTGSSGSISTGSFPALLQAFLVASGAVDGGTGRVWPAHNVTPTPSPGDSRWTFTSFAPVSAGSSLLVAASTNGAVAEFTSDKPGNIASLYWTNDSGPFTIHVDGVLVRTVASGTGAQSLTGDSFTGLADTNHKVTITTTSAATVTIGAASVNRSIGVTVENAGNGGAQSSTWLPTAAWNYNGPTVKAASNDAHLILVESTLVNDGQNGVSAATHQANMLAIINDWKTVGDVILWIPPAPDTALVSAVIFGALRQAAYDAATAAGVPVLDISTRWGSFAAANALGYFSDVAHPTSAGYTDIARAVLELLAVPGGARAGDTAWTAATLANGWVNYGDPFADARYRKDANGFVHLSGIIKNGTATPGTTLFTIPSGYRPVDTEAFPITSVDAFGEVWVAGDGTVKIQAGSATWLSLSGITFLGEN